MASPTEVNNNTTTSASSSSLALNMPASIVAGRLLLAISTASINDSATTAMSGWTKIGAAQRASGSGTLAVFAKIAAGSDTGTVTGTSGARSVIVYQISGGPNAASDVEVTFANAPTGLDPPAHTPSAGSDDYLWIACYKNTNSTSPNAPTNYTGLITALTGTHMAASARRALTAASEDPAIFTIAGSSAQVTATISVPPTPEVFGDITFVKPDPGAAYGTTGPSVPYPSPIGSGDLMVLISGQKPVTAGGGTVTDPSGWTVAGSLLDSGGYATTVGADVGNMNLRVYTKVATGSESGTFTLSAADSSVIFGHILRLTSTARDAWDVAVVTGEDTSAGNVSVTFGSDPGITAEDYILAPFVIPTDVTTPAQFSAQALSATGVTFDTVYEVVEYDSATGNDLGGFLARARVLSGTSSAAPVLTATAGGTTTNVRGPAAFIRIRRVTAAAFDPTRFMPFFR